MPTAAAHELTHVWMFEQLPTIEQTEGEDKARALKVLQAHNAGLTRELGQVDMSLMQALEDNGLTLDSVRLQNTPMSRRLGRRR